MRKILHISKFYTPYYGGIEDVVNSIVGTLKGDYDQQVICFNNGYRTTVDIVDNVTVIRVGIVGIVASQPIPMGYWHSLYREIQSFRPDYIHVHLPNPLICSLLRLVPTKGIKIVVHWHADILNNPLYWLCRREEQQMLKRADCIIATSKEYVEASSPLRNHLQKVMILPNTIVEKKLAMPTQTDIDALRAKFGKKKIVLAVGRHVPYKGLPYLIEAAQYLSEDVAVLIAGEGPDTAYLHQLAERQTNIHFLGRLSNNDLSLYLHAADVFAFPSIDRREAFGVALAEALYCGVPAVTFAIQGSGVNWVNQDKVTGIVVKEKSAQKYADALNTLLNNDILRKTYGCNAKTWVREHFLANQINVLHKIYG